MDELAGADPAPAGEAGPLRLNEQSRARKGPWWWPLLAAGLVSAAVYLIVVLRLPWWRYGVQLQSWSQILGDGWGPFLAMMAGIAILAAAYGLGWVLVRRGRASRRIVWAFAILFAATLFWMLPITSDLFSYLVQAHLLTDLGQNPLEAAPLEGPLDPLVLAYAGPYAGLSSAYGPAWTLLSAPATAGRHDVAGGLFYLKGLATGAYLGSAWLVERLVRRLRSSDGLSGLYLFAWNPLVLLLAVGDGHNDMVMIGLALLAVWFLLQARWGLAFGVLALSAWVKYVSALLVPLFLIYAWQCLGERSGGRRWPALFRALAWVAAASALVLLPLWGRDGMAGLVQRFLRPANWQAMGSGLPGWAMSLGMGLFFLSYMVLLVWLARRGSSSAYLGHGAFLVLLLAFFLGAARSQPWHFIWPVALAGLSNQRWASPLVAGLSILFLGVQAWVEWGAPGWPVGA
jgi:alpha-1,6-mannosyltransferase